MAEVKPSTSRGADAVDIVGEASCSGADVFTDPESVPAAIAAEPPSFLTWMWVQILTACSGVWGARGGGLSGPGMLELASGAQHSLVDSKSEVLSRIAASKSTWSEVPGRDIPHAVSVPCLHELSVWEELKASAPRFFRDDSVNFLEPGRLIGEGGQAQIFEAKVKGFGDTVILKVFKLDAGFSLADLKLHWPRSLRKDGEDCCNESSRSIQEKSSGFVFEDATSNMQGFRCIIMGATFLKDERFAFLMYRYWGDLRTLINLRVEDNAYSWEFDLLSQNKREQPPFSFHESIDIMVDIARGMLGLHAEGILHRDLKAANILILSRSVGEIVCNVADYECSVFVQGTGFWRAPEVLQELQKKEEDRNGEIWTEEVDVYSFGMTCYEILTGLIPFEGCTKSKWGDVIKGERPSLPDYIFPELRELVEACWHAQPSQRPSFEAILEDIIPIWEGHTTWN